jgi:hypothetical protein
LGPCNELRAAGPSGLRPGVLAELGGARHFCSVLELLLAVLFHFGIARPDFRFSGLQVGCERGWQLGIQKRKAALLQFPWQDTLAR